MSTIANEIVNDVRVTRSTVYYGRVLDEDGRIFGNYLFVKKGDLVKVVSIFNDEVVGRVIDVRKRFGLQNQGTTSVNPLITLLLEGGEEHLFDNSWVVEVLEKSGKSFSLKNIFADSGCVSQTRKFVQTSKKGILCGHLGMLATVFLAEMNICLEREIDLRKLQKLFEKQGQPGCVDSPHPGLFSVRKKSFGKWIRRNAERICLTVKAMNRQETLRATSDERDFSEGNYGPSLDDMYPEGDVFEDSQEQDDSETNPWDGSSFCY